MKKIKAILSISILLLVVFFTLLLYKMNNNMGSDASIQEFVADHCLTNYEINIKDSDKKANELTDYNEISSLFSERKEPILVLRIKETQCSACVDKEMERIRECMPLLKENVCLLTSNSSQRNIKRFFLKNKSEVLYADIPSNFFDDFYFDNFQAPCYFLLHPDMRISHIYLPEKELTDLTREYIESIARWIND